MKSRRSRESHAPRAARWLRVSRIIAQVANQSAPIARDSLRRWRLVWPADRLHILSLSDAVPDEKARGRREIQCNSPLDPLGACQMHLDDCRAPPDSASRARDGGTHRHDKGKYRTQSVGRPGNRESSSCRRDSCYRLVLKLHYSRRNRYRVPPYANSVTVPDDAAGRHPGSVPRSVRPLGLIPTPTAGQPGISVSSRWTGMTASSARRVSRIPRIVSHSMAHQGLA